MVGFGISHTHTFQVPGLMNAGGEPDSVNLYGAPPGTSDEPAVREVDGEEEHGEDASHLHVGAHRAKLAHPRQHGEQAHDHLG